MFDRPTVRHLAARIAVLVVAAAALLCCARASAALAAPAPGDVEWQYTAHSGSLTFDDEAKACAVNAAGDLVAVGYLGYDAGWPAFNPFVADLTAGNTLAWSYSGSADAELHSLAFGASGQVWAAGSKYSAAGWDYLVVQASSSGSTEHVYNGPAHRGDNASAVTCAADGSAYVTGGSRAKDGDVDIATIGYGANGKRQWVARFNSPSNHEDIGQAVAIRGNALYVAGWSVRNHHGDDIVVLKYNRTTGRLLWSRYYDDASHKNDYASAMVVTASGVYVAGSGKNSSAAAGDALLLHYTASGALQWAHYTAGSPGEPDNWTDLCAAPDGSVVTTGYVYHVASHDDVATAKYTAAGVRSWRAFFSSDGVQLDSGQAVSVDQTTGDIYVAGTISSTATGEDMGAVAYDPTGATLWHTTVDGGVAGYDWATDCALSQDGGLYVVGSVATASFGNDFAVMRIAR
jgi:hypothetical protein